MAVTKAAAGEARNSAVPTRSSTVPQRFSADRAASVVKWLVKNGVDKARLTSAGFGPDKPLADNETEDGRYKNRRVEFHIEP